MMDVPWFMLSPSPVSLIQYAVMIWIMSRYFFARAHYKRAPRIMSILDGLWSLVAFVCLTDGIWVSLTMYSWLPLHPGDFMLLLISLVRDLTGFSAGILMLADHFKSGVLRFSLVSAGLLLMCFGMMCIWFDLAPSPGYTDYVYAWRHGYPLEIILGSWLLSQWIMRIPLWLLILSIRKKVPLGINFL